jgi:TonB family protein
MLMLWIALAVVPAGCVGASGEEVGPPAGWEGTLTQWWKVDSDSAGLFRDLETLEAMGVSTVQPLEEGRDRLAMAVKRSLIRLYRNGPEVVDSLFERAVTPRIRQATLSGSFQDQVEHFKKEGYRLIGNQFQEPRAALQLGKDVPVAYPDSLRRRHVEGRVQVQVRLDEQGNPRSVELIEGVHPVLDAIALRATTQMRWRPAYLMRSGNWRPVSSWVRFGLSFNASPPETAGRS